MKTPKILIVDDDPDFCLIIANYLKFAGFESSAIHQPDELAKLNSQRFDIVLLDIFVHQHNGLELLPEIREHHPEAKIVVVTSRSSVPLAVSSMEAGACTFMEKSTDPQTLVAKVRELLHDPPATAHVASPTELGIVGESPAIQQVLQQIEQIKDFNTSILILGESGTGKELVAKAIHKSSKRSVARFEAINCGAIPESLLESELFGFRKGAFTDAKSDKKGLFEVCSGGTLFLDEVGEMPLAMQVKLLRVLQEQELRPIGADKTIAIDTRIIAATNRNLEDEIAAGRFREDLYYRLSVMPIHIPPLRHRPEDIAALGLYFAKLICKRYQLPELTLTNDDLTALKSYHWPGNIRELQNIVERAIITARQGQLDIATALAPMKSSAMAHQAPPNSTPFIFEFDAAKEEFEKSYVCQLLKNTKGNISEAAKLSGKFRSDIYRLLERYGLRAEDFK